MAGERTDGPRLRGQRKVPRAVREPHMLEMAGRVFAVHGFHGASMDEIAETAGVSKPMLYSYFGSKEGLYFAYTDLAYRELIAAIDAAVAGAGPDPEGQLRAGTLAYYVYVGEHRDAFRVLFREMGDPGGGQLAAQRHRLARRVGASIEAMVLASEARVWTPAHTEALSEAWIGAARSMANWWLDHPELPAASVATLLLEFVMSGVRGLCRPQTEQPA
ncbi:MAG TPA: TetR/AcrR family transcriptional regulator [Candidatus Dormibacteraeota bacterium]|nr:TetR/AcrR family transcriptional regulator [Candidatus Dormibacteraeota bacterium]